MDTLTAHRWEAARREQLTSTGHTSEQEAQEMWPDSWLTADERRGTK